MKTSILFFIGILLLSHSSTISKKTMAGNVPSKEGSINVFTSPELFNLTMKWVSEYCIKDSEQKIKVIKSTDDDLAAILNSGEGVCFITDESSAVLNNQSKWSLVLGRDVIVPVMNAANPFQDEICRKGISTEGFVRILNSPEKPNWGMLVGNVNIIPDIPIHFYTTNDPIIKSGVDNFLNNNKVNIDGIKTSSGQEMISAIQKDPNALGFCKLVQIFDQNHQSIADNIRLVPIDKNGNGKIDYMEAIYDNLQDFSRGVWIGKYPRALSGNIYSVSSKKPKNEAEVAFLSWVLTDGQQFLNANGYSDLVLNERKSQLDKINEPDIYASAPTNSYYIFMIILLILFGIVILGFIMDAFVKRIKNKNEIFPVGTTAFKPVFDEDSVIVPKGLYFDKTHTWAFMKKDGAVKIGIDDFLQHITGSLTRIEMRNAGEKIKKGDRLLTLIRKGKQLNIYAPVSGKIRAQNKALINNSSLLNAAPYGEGWIYEIEPANWLLEIQFLNMAEKYKTWLKVEFLRLKDFFATVVKADSSEYALIALQDGGALTENILADLEPEVWEDFQTKFIDISK